MQISCERCNTVYALDDKLIPPGGAPVQCTRCGLVFTAKPPQGTVAAPPPPKPTAPPASARMQTPQVSRQAQVAPAPAPEERRATMMFGAGGQPAPAPQKAPPQSTMMFGAVSATPPPAQAPAPARTAAPPPAASPARMTQMFGARPPDEPKKPQSQPTAMFGAFDPHLAQTISMPPMAPLPPLSPPAHAAPPPSGFSAATANPASTMMFGAAGVSPPAPEGERAPVLEMPALPKAPAGRPPPAAAAEKKTDPELEAQAQAVGPAPSWAAPVGAASPDDTAPSSPPTKARRQARPAPEPAQAPEARPSIPPRAAVGSQTMQLQLELKKRQRLLPVVLGVIVAVLVVAAGTIAFLKLRTPPADPALVAADGKALALLERDDTESIQKAIATWESLEKKAPDYVPFKANQIIAHVFLTQDLRDEIRRLTTAAAQVDKDMRKLQDKKEPADWIQKASVLRDELIKIKNQVDPLQTQASAHDDRAGELLKSTKALVEKPGVVGDDAAIFRASAIYYASKGHETAEKLADIYSKRPDDRKVLHDDARAFADLAIAGRFAQTRITPGDKDKGIAAAQAALRKDPNLLRAHLFIAKMYLANREFEKADAAASGLIALNAAHETAVKLKAEIAQASAQAAKEKPAEAK